MESPHIRLGRGSRTSSDNATAVSEDPDLLLVQTFYNGLEQSVKISVDATAGGALMRKSIEVAKGLLEDMTSSNYHWSSKRITPKRSSGKYDVDSVTFLANRVDVLA